MTPDPYWRDEALCREVDASLFFPRTKGDNMLDAKRMCAICPVRVDRTDLRAEIARLRARRWTQKAIGLRLGVSEAVVYRVLKEHRDAGGEAA